MINNSLNLNDLAIFALVVKKAKLYSSRIGGWDFQSMGQSKNLSAGG